MKMGILVCYLITKCIALDVVIPSIEKDLRTLEECIKSAKKYVPNVRRVIVVSPKKLTDKAEWFDEANYPFSKESIAAYLQTSSDHHRLGWILQQLLKLYAPFVIPDISKDILILDSDTIFLKKMQFFHAGRPLYATHRETHPPFFDHINRLLPHVPVNRNISGVIHHMLFQQHVMESLFAEIRAIHKLEPWQAICSCIDPKELSDGSFSEYEIYFSYAFYKFNAKIRNIKWKAVGQDLYEKRGVMKRKGYSQITWHSFM